MEKFTLNIPAGVIEIDTTKSNVFGQSGVFSLTTERAKQIADSSKEANRRTETWAEFLKEALDLIKPENTNECLFIFFLFGRLYEQA